WVKDDGEAPPPSGRPKVAGVSAGRAPGSAAEPCPLGTIKVTVVRADNRKAIGGLAVVASGPGFEPLQHHGGRPGRLPEGGPGVESVVGVNARGQGLQPAEPPDCPDVEVTP